MSFKRTSTNWPGQLGLAVFIVIAVMLRRPDQYLHANVIFEEGTQILPDLLARGLLSVADPINGYTVVLSKLVSWCALCFGLSAFPAASAILTMATISALFFSISLAPTSLQHKRLCAIAAVLAPIGTETFASSIMLVCHASILLMLTVLWRPGEKNGLRYGALLLAGLSSPFAVFALPAFAWCWFRGRQRSDLICLFIAMGISLLQIGIAHQSAATGGATLSNALWAVPLLAKMAGQFLVFGWSSTATGALGLTFLYLTIVPRAGTEKNRQEENMTTVLMLLVLVTTIAAITFRLGGQVPMNFNGPNHYYNLPFLIFSWLLIQRLPNRPFIDALPVTIMVIAVGVNSYKHYTMHQEAINWKPEAATVLREGHGSLPIYFFNTLDVNLPLEVRLQQRHRACNELEKSWLPQCVVVAWIFSRADYIAPVKETVGQIEGDATEGLQLIVHVDVGQSTVGKHREFHTAGKVAPTNIEAWPSVLNDRNQSKFDVRFSFADADTLKRFKSSYCITYRNGNEALPRLIANGNPICRSILMPAQ